MSAIGFESVASNHPANAKKTTDALDGTIAAIALGMEGRMTKLAAAANTKSGNIASLIEQVKTNPQGSAKEAQARMEAKRSS